MSKTSLTPRPANETLYVNCSHPSCCRSTRLDVQTLVARLGAAHGSMHWDLCNLFRCWACDAAGRDRRPVFFTCVPDYEGMERERARNWKPTFKERSFEKPTLTRREVLSKVTAQEIISGRDRTFSG
jgi:hypothetical protein